MDTSSIVQRALFHESTGAVRTRGREYQSQGRVSLLHCGTANVEAVVKGTERYNVRLGIEAASDALDFSCSCPYAEAGALCKHVWATALEADQKEMARAFRQSLAAALREAWAVGSTDAATSSALTERLSFTARSTETEEARQRGRWTRLLGPPTLAHPLPEDATAEDWYLIDERQQAMSYVADFRLVVQIARRNFLKRGGLGKPTSLGRLPERNRPAGAEGTLWELAKSTGFATLGRELSRQLLPELARLGRLGFVPYGPGRDVVTLSWAGGAPWHVVLDVAEAEHDGRLTVEGVLEREGEHGRESSPLGRATVLPVDLLVLGGQLFELKKGHDGWLRELTTAPLSVDRASLRQIAKELVQRPYAPRFRDLRATGWVAERVAPKPRLRLQSPGKNQQLLTGTLSFFYGDREVGAGMQSLSTHDHLIERDLEREAASMARLRELGWSVAMGPQTPINPYAVALPLERFPKVAPALFDGGFVVELEGKPYRQLRLWHPFVESHQDWFELKGELDFEGERLSMPELLRAVRERQHWVRLQDGSFGVLPEAWLDSLSTLAEWVPPKSKRLRFHMSQAALIEGALGGATHLGTDDGFAAMKARFQRFQQIARVKKPRGFQGALREYQELALGWLRAMDELGFGGCLADDMGLGKTVVVLAWLLRRQSGQRLGQARLPSLVVVPRSLLFNWQRESERFAPKLRMLLHHGPDRAKPGAHFRDYDVVLTSYGTLRRDVEELAKQRFDAVVLDEAHSIKNEWTGSHQAARALDSRRRLALTGTPVENHLGELWNLMTFLNPEVFAALGHLQKAFEKRRPSATALDLVIKKTLAPFILRRTKAEVAKDLPARTEKTLHVTLSSEERALYDDLLQFYRRRLLERKALLNRPGPRGKGNDNARQTAEALEALLRLRQAACHPGLLDEARKGQSSAKLELLLEQLEALREGGHKALVFSQFTQLLALVKPRLEQAGINYVYLDGQTAQRDAVVDRFQTDPSVGVFLVSLKAGGVGLNLVAADYVFLLDPWWNPASEAQAIDRAHRIGQTKSVIAYRLLSRNTIEEKVAQLQDEKRELAQALFGDSASFAAKFTREDLEALLES